VAILIPEIPDKITHGEKLILSKCGRELDRDWICLHSLWLRKHETKAAGEADIVVISTRGVFALEVKGGSVSCNNGVWKIEKSNGQFYNKTESPWEQADGALHAIRKVILNSAPELKDILTGYGVVMPHIAFVASAPNIIPEVLLDKRNISRDIGFYIGQIAAYWLKLYQEKHGRQYRNLRRDEIQKIREILRPNMEVMRSLGSYLNEAEQEMVKLTNSQIRASRGLENNPRTVTKGKAGSGKTIIAADRALRFANEGFKVLYLCFNKRLAEHVATSLIKENPTANVTVKHLHALYMNKIHEAGIGHRIDQFQGDQRTLYGSVFPETFCEAMLEKPGDLYDVVVIDEAQDLLTLAGMDALDLLLKGGLNQGRWHMFLDPLQNIYAGDNERIEPILQEAGFAAYELLENCRNTRQVALLTNLVSGVDLEYESCANGPRCEPIFYKSVSEGKKQLAQQIRNLVSNEVAPEDIIVLSTRQYAGSLANGLIAGEGHPILEVPSAKGSSHIEFSTIHAFKGMERRAVLVTDLAEISDENWTLLHYIGMSRAKSLVVPLIPDEAKPSYERMSHLFGKKLR